MATLVLSHSSLAEINHVAKHVQTMVEEVSSPFTSPAHTVNDLLLQRARQTPNVPLVAYPGSFRGTTDYVHYTAEQLDRFADEAARKYMSLGLSPKEDNGIDVVVALLAPSSLDYVVSIFALSRMGYSLLLLSNRLSTEAYVSLLSKTNCKCIFATSNFNQSIVSISSEISIDSYPVLEKSVYDLPLPSGPYFTRHFDGPRASQSTVFIIHSSGSTGLPKPIFQTHKAAITNYSSGLAYRAFLTLPLYHNHGMSCLFRAIYAGNEIALFNANLPLTSPNLIAAMSSLSPGGFHGVPYTLKLLAETEKGIELLAACEVVMFGGSSCPDELGDKLVNGGVNLISHYGATEIGQLMTSVRPRNDKAWSYVRPLEGRREFMKFDLVAPNTYELVVLDGLPSKVVSNSDNPPRSFRTSDTFVPHATLPDAWKYIARLDDRITLVNGEKVLPITVEHQIRSNDYVQECWMFGINRALPGLMIVPSEHAAHLSKAQIKENIWPAIQAVNARVEGFSQLSKDMIEILEVGTEYPQTDKGTMIRARTYVKFGAQIDAVYTRFENGVGEKLTLNIEQLQRWLLDAFHVTMGSDVVGIDTDLFTAGVDSLQAITVFSMIKREIDVGNGKIGQNIAFEQPSVAALAAYLYNLRTGTELKAKDELRTMAELITKYSTFKPHIAGESIPIAQTIVLTGATGSLGAHVLAQLIARPNVAKIYCLVRASTPANAHDRVLSTLWSKLIPPVFTKKLICLPSDLRLPTLGLPDEVIATLRQTLTKVIHCAWAVNFNLGVSSFEEQHIKGTSNLLKLCLSTTTMEPASLYFCSSISAAAGTPIPASISEAYVPELAHAQDMGYARSKLVTENIIKNCVAQTGMKAKVLRIGQIIGDSQRGLWNSTEAIPLLIRSSITLEALPELDETPSWMPSDLVAKSILDLAGLNECEQQSHTFPESNEVVYHVQNTKTFHWSRDLLPALRAAGLEFRSVSQREWIRLLRGSDQDAVRNPTIKLLDFFSNKYDNDRPGRSGLVFQTTKTGAASVTVGRGFDVVSSGLIAKMVQMWINEWSA